MLVSPTAKDAVPTLAKSDFAEGKLLLFGKICATLRKYLSRRQGKSSAIAGDFCIVKKFLSVMMRAIQLKQKYEETFSLTRSGYRSRIFCKY